MTKGNACIMHAFLRRRHRIHWRYRFYWSHRCPPRSVPIVHILDPLPCFDTGVRQSVPSILKLQKGLIAQLMKQMCMQALLVAPALLETQVLCCHLCFLDSVSKDAFA